MTTEARRRRRGISISLPPVTDSFTRPDNALTLGSTESPVIPWEALHGSTWGISGNQAKGIVAPFGVVRANMGSPNGKASIKFTGTQSGTRGVAARIQDYQNYFRAVGSGSTIYLQRFIAAAATNLGTFSHTMVVNDKLSLECRSDTIKVYLNDVVIITVTDSNFMSITYWGLETDNSTQQFDDWSWVP